MASGNNPNGDNQNNIQRRVLITPEQFLENQRWIQQRIALFTQQNVIGLQNYLSQQVMHGERARRQLELLQQAVNQGSLPALPLPPPASADLRTTPVPPSPSAYAINGQPVAGPSSIPVNGGDTVQTKPQSSFNFNPAPKIVPSSSGQVPSSREHQDIYTRQTATSFSTDTANYARADSTQRQQTGQPHQGPLDSANINPGPVQQSIHSSRPSDSRQTLYLQQQQQRPGAATSLGMQASSSQRQNAPAQTYTQLAMSNQAPIAIPSISGYYQGVSNTALNHPFTSSSLAGALGENVSVPIQQDRDNARVSTHNASHQSSGMTTGRRETTDSRSFTNPGVMSTSASILPDASSSLAVALQSMSDKRLQDELHDLVNKRHEAESHANSKLFIAQDGIGAPSLQDHKNPPTISQNVKSTPTTYENQSTSGTSAQLNVDVVPANFPETQPSVPNTIPLSSSSRTTGATSTGVTTNHLSTALPTTSQAPVSDSFGQNFANVNVSQRSTLVGLNAPNLQDYYYAASHPTSNNASNMPPSGLTSQPISSVLSVPNRFTTPPPGRNRPSAPVTPASANKRTLAKDILRALNRQPEKRKTPASESSGSDADTERPPLKKQVTEPSPPNDPASIEEDVFGSPSMLPFATEPDNAARIEEVDDTVAESVDVIDLPTLPADAVVADISEVMPLTSAESDVRSNKSLPPIVESRASSEDAFNVDTMLQPPEEAEPPLFLPSPEPESPRDSPHLSEHDVRETMDGGSLLVRSRELRRKHGHVWEPCVEVPTLTTAQRRQYLKSSDKNIEATSSKGPVADEGCLRLAQEAEAIAASRLRRRPCLWNDCYYVANSASNLKSHILEHAVAEKNVKIFPCWWGDCLRRFNKLEALAQHLQNHVRKTIFCAYEGCDAQVTHRLELLKHVESSHPSGSTLRPSTKPFAPPAQALPPLGTMFAYQVVNLPVAMAPVSHEPRTEVASQDTENRFIGVVLDAPKLNARNQIQRDRPRDVPKLMGDWQDRYDFLERWTVKHNPNCEDLESSKATEEIENGIVLAPDAAGPQGPLREQAFTSRMDQIKLNDKPHNYVVIEDDAEQPEGDLSEVKIEDVEDVPADFSGSTSPLNPSQPIQAENYSFAVGEAQVVESGSA